MSDPIYSLVNESGLPDEMLLNNPSVREIASSLSSWVNNARSAQGRSSLFDRGAYAAPDNIYDQMRIARNAVENDDIVGGVAETTEGFAFQGIRWESKEVDEADVFNQIARDINMDDLVRKMWREEFATSQVVVGLWWDWRTYKVRGTTKNGNERKKSFRVYCPVAVTILDSLKVVPVGSTTFGQDMLCWRGTASEVRSFAASRDPEDPYVDPLMENFFIGKYNPDPGERKELADLKVDPDHLLVFDPTKVWRHTLTRSDYDRFAPVRIKSCFRLLDLKQQLMEADRVNLIGAANYILLVRKGSKEEPAHQAEIDNLNENFKYIAKLPVIVADHRLDIEIITPKIDLTLNPEKYDVIDSRILSRLIGALSLSGRGQRNENSLTLSRSVAKVLENRRHMLKRTLEQRLARATVEHPANAGVFKGGPPSLAFVPTNVALDVDAALVQAISKARDKGDISRETWLEELGFDQATEAQRREIEDERYDDVFKPIAVPFSSPALLGGGATKQDGPGRPVGGGEPDDDATEIKPKSKNGNTSTRST